MEKPNRKITWVHVTFTDHRVVEVVFVTERWKGGKYFGRRRKDFEVVSTNYLRIGKIARILNTNANTRYVICGWNGYSACWEAILS